LRRRHLDFARRSLKIGLCVALTAASATRDGRLQREGCGASINRPSWRRFEGLYHTEVAPLYLFGWVNENQQRVQFGIAIPQMLTFLTYGNVTTPVTGLERPALKGPPAGEFRFSDLSRDGGDRVRLDRAGAARGFPLVARAAFSEVADGCGVLCCR
jgi:cytochrome bd-type quinol oxidase subunit 1